MDISNIQWKHREDSPGYFVSVDGTLQILLDDDGKFVVCKMVEEVGKGFEVVAGPTDSLQNLGVPPTLIDEGEDMMLDDIVLRSSRGEKVGITVLLPE